MAYAPPPRPASEAELGFEQRRPVQWFSPSVLARAGIKVVLSAAFGDYLDKRELQHSLGGDVHTDHLHDDEIWLDLIADTADGFDPTYTVAWSASQRTLQPEGCDRPLPRGRFLILAGDEVYPIGSPKEYENRFIGPFKAALPWTDADHPYMLAIPGNHDWYDGLTGFMRVFGQQKWIGGRRTIQRRSYFAIGLPHRHWLWGIDIQNDAYVDAAQIAYFKDAAALMQPDDRLILCSAKPSWTDGDPDSYRNLEFVERELVAPGVDTVLMLSGDKHHYARYRNIDDDGNERAKVTAGGGGAFLSATHTLPEKVDVPKAVLGDDDPRDAHERFDLAEPTFPSVAKSRSMTFGALLVGFRNPSFLIVPALLNLLLFAANSAGLRPDAGSVDEIAPDWSYADLLTGRFRGSLSVVLVLMLFFLLSAFCKVNRRSPRWLVMAERGIAGAVHTAAQVLMHGLIAWLSIQIVDALGFEGVMFMIAVGVLVLVLGAALGSLVFGAYLVVALAVFGWHANENFSASRFESYKNFLRIHVGADGITVYPIGIERPCTRWTVAADPPSPEDSYLAPASGAIATKLIEPAFKI
jgi:hypothetical protein